ncbi:aminoglycoside phosphotransferase family protein [Yoonia sp. R2331]|uniref:aminoglycoside phosphotransferase family protein n=1 Tax=Yoonia sp. R2331 TaxID=3237238 RepID=UPI0034E5959C
MEIPADVARLYHLTPLRHVAKTGIADIWHVRLPDGRDAALKVYEARDPRDEAPGFDVMRTADGSGAAQVFAYGDGVALLEWLDGPTLGDRVRAGNVATADHDLVQTSQAMHAAITSVNRPLRSVRDWFEALFAMTFDPSCPASLVADIRNCQQLARTLLATEQVTRPLHGDYHHDNVKRGPNGYRAFDAKGVMGEAAFEASNTFRNPLGADDVIRDETRAMRLAEDWAIATQTPQRRILQWAAARGALSLAWSCSGHLTPDTEDLDLVPLYLRLAAAASPDTPR